MDFKTMAVLVALAPGIACAFLGFLAEVVPALKVRFDELINSLEAIEWLADLVFEFSFIGSAVIGVFGVKTESFETLALTLMWFMGMLFIHRLLLRRKRDLAELEKRLQDDIMRKNMAGLIRSIFRSELSKATSNRGASDAN